MSPVFRTRREPGRAGHRSQSLSARRSRSAGWQIALALALAAGSGGGLRAGAGETAAPPAQADLRPVFEAHGLAPESQGARNTCSVFTMAGAIEFALVRRNGQGPRLSVEFLNWAANRVRGADHDGGFFSDIWKGFERYGVSTAALLPYQAHFDPAVVPGEAALADAARRRAAGLQLHWIKEWNVKTGLSAVQCAAIKQALDRGWPVCAGLRWPRHEQWKNDVLQLCPPEAVFDGHSVLLVGYRDEPAAPGGGVFVFRNSSGRARHGRMPYGYALLYLNDALWVE